MLLGGSDSKESACNVGDLGSISESGRSPGEGNGNTFQYSCLENSMDRGAWWDAVHGAAKSDMTEWLTLSLFTLKSTVVPTAAGKQGLALTEQTRVAGWRRERRWETAELRNRQQQVADGKLQSHSHLTSMEPTRVSLKERNLKVRVRMTYLLFHHFPFTLFLPPPQPCLALQDPTSEGLCKPLLSVQSRKSAENHLFLP